MGREIKRLSPRAIFVLGNSAKKSLQVLSGIPEFSGFKDLENHKVTEDYEKVLSGYRVILSVYPGQRTRVKYGPIIKESFSKIKRG